jgi:hypothetical protein
LFNIEKSQSILDVTLSIFSMQGEKRPPEYTANNDETKRTTIILERSERDFIDSLIRNGKEVGIKPLFSKMLEIYKTLMVYDWRFPGEYYFGISRIALMNVELINIAAQFIPKDKWREMGRKEGEALKVSFETSQNIETSKPENWDAVFYQLRIQGFGDFSRKDKYLVLKMPFLNEMEIWQGLLESLLDVELEKKNAVPPFVFSIKNKPLP